MIQQRPFLIKMIFYIFTYFLIDKLHVFSFYYPIISTYE